VEYSGTKDKPWLESYPDHVPAELELEPMTLPEMIEATCARSPDRRAVVCYLKKGWEPAYTYSELEEAIKRCAHTMGRLGVRPGDPVALMLPNCPQYPVAFFGALLAGAMVVPLSMELGPHRLTEHLADCGARTMIALDLQYRTLLGVLEQTKVERVVVASHGELLNSRQRLLYRWTKGRGVPPLRSGDFDLWELIWAMPPYPPEVKVRPDDPAVLFYSVARGEGQARVDGGSETDTTDNTDTTDSGPDSDTAPGTETEVETVPSTMVLNHANLLAGTAQLKSWLPDLRPGLEMVNVTSPLSHPVGLQTGMLLPVRVGGTMLMFPGTDPSRIIQGSTFYRTTLFPGNTQLLEDLARHPTIQQSPLSSVNIYLSLGPAIGEGARRTLGTMSNGRVITAHQPGGTLGLTHLEPAGEALGSGDTLGLPLPGVECRIVDGAGQVLPQGGEGQLQVRGPQMMSGWWDSNTRRPRLHKAMMWHPTGETVRMDEAGFFHQIAKG